MVLGLSSVTLRVGNGAMGRRVGWTGWLDMRPLREDEGGLTNAGRSVAAGTSAEVDADADVEADADEVRCTADRFCLIGDSTGDLTLTERDLSPRPWKRERFSLNWNAGPSAGADPDAAGSKVGRSFRFFGDAEPGVERVLRLRLEGVRSC